MKQTKLRANIGYKRRYFKSPVTSVMADNHPQQQFVVCEPDEAWVADITYIKMCEAWLYLAVVVDLFSRKIIGWSMQSTMTADIVIKAMRMAILRRPQATGFLVHTDQVSQHASGDYQDFLAGHSRQACMSRRGHCTAILAMFPRMNMKIHIQRQAECLLNRGKITSMAL